MLKQPAIHQFRTSFSYTFNNIYARERKTFNMKTRIINIKRWETIISDEGKEKRQQINLKVRINNAIPPSHFMCEGNRRG